MFFIFKVFRFVRTKFYSYKLVATELPSVAYE